MTDMYASFTTRTGMRAWLGQITETGEGDPYLGPYEVTPQVYEQTLETKNKSMRDDVRVYEIPYAEVSNIYGTTVVIAS